MRKRIKSSVIRSIWLTAAVLLGAEVTKAGDAFTAFKFDGTPIHPGVVWQFEVDLADAADAPPRVKTVDLGSCLKSQKNAPERTATGYLTCKDGDRWFRYRHLGMTQNGTHVLITASGGGGGTLVAMTVMFLRIDSEDYFVFTDRKKQPEVNHRSVLKCVGQIVLGDRDDGTVDLHGETLTLGPSRYREKAVTYELAAINK
jgi:hypothetical protein